MAKRALVVVRPVVTAPSEKTVKLTLGGLFTVTAATPAAWTTVNDADELVEVSFAGTAAAAAIASLTVAAGPGAGAGAAEPPPPPPPQPASAPRIRAAPPQAFHEFFIRPLQLSAHNGESA